MGGNRGREYRSGPKMIMLKSNYESVKRSSETQLVVSKTARKELGEALAQRDISHPNLK